MRVVTASSAARGIRAGARAGSKAGAGAGAGPGDKSLSAMRSKSTKLARMYACEEEGCDYMATKSNNLTRHMRAHTGEQPFVCEEEGCDYATKKSGDLKRHMRTHTGQPFCDRRRAVTCGDDKLSPQGAHANAPG